MARLRRFQPADVAQQRRLASATISPLAISRLTLSSARFLPKVFDRFLTEMAFMELAPVPACN